LAFLMILTWTYENLHKNMVTRTQEHGIFNTTYKQFETNQLKYV
jgi:hypothetical protein